MNVAAVVLVVLAAAAFGLLLWAIGRAVTVIGERAPHGRGRPHQYLAGRLDGVRITALVGGEDDLLVTLAAQAGDSPRTSDDPLARVFCVTASECSLARVRRWRNEATPLRAYLSPDGAIMLADPVLGGNAACEPSRAVAWHPRERAVSPDQSPADDSSHEHDQQSPRRFRRRSR
jgi:hypothetical protein